MEAMACGLPVVAAENSGSLAILSENRGGILVPSGDYKKLSEEVVKLALKPSKIEMIGNDGRDYVAQKYDWTTAIIPKYKQIYKKLRLK